MNEQVKKAYATLTPREQLIIDSTIIELYEHTKRNRELYTQIMDHLKEDKE